MTPQEQTIEALNQAIKAQSELISYLKAEIERLKTTTVYFPPQPNQGPITVPNQPLWPNNQPFIGTPLPPGHQQWPYGITITSDSVSSHGIATLNGDVTTSFVVAMDDLKKSMDDLKKSMPIQNADAGLG